MKSILCLLIFFLSTFTNLNHSCANLISSFYEVNFDSTDAFQNPSIFGGIQADMFNERGYYNSNSFSAEESQIVNDYNGNLQLSIPMYFYKLNGDLNLNISLNYNGSVGHSSLNCDENFLTGPYDIPVTNINTPEFIISLNGWAVQTSNFEIDYLSRANYTGQTISGSEVSMLTNGYHITSKMSNPSTLSRDQISLLRGDGSVLTLENIESSSYEFIGEYYSTERGNYTRGFVKEIPGSNSSTPDRVKRRTLELHQGDGLIYYFQEEYVYYIDYDEQDHIDKPYLLNRPKCFYLNKITDRFGNYIELIYKRIDKQGRAKFTNIRTSTFPTNIAGVYDFNFNYNFSSTISTLDISGTGRGDFGIKLTGTEMNSTKNHLTYINEIITPENKSIYFTNSSYPRKFNNARYNLAGLGSINIDFSNSNNPLKRISRVENFNKGKTVYFYNGNNELNTVNLDYLNSGSIAVKGNLNFYGQGRDPFYVNMLDSIYYIDKNTNDRYKADNYKYQWIRTSAEPYEQDPIDETDFYSATKTVSPNSSQPLVSNINNSITYYSSIKRYKIFKYYYNALNLGTRNYPGYTKLYHEKDSTSDGITNTKDYFYEIGTPTVYQNTGHVYRYASFLDTLITNTIITLNNETSISNDRFKYTFNENFPIYSFNVINPIKELIATDNYGLSSKTNFKIFNDTSLFWIGGRGSTDPYSKRDTSVFYKISVPEVITKYKQINQILEKTENTFIEDEHSNLGYIAQILETKHSYYNSNDYQEINFNYLKNDTLGAFLYGFLRPGVEGNLKSQTDPNGNLTNFSYLLLHNPTSGITPIQHDYFDAIIENLDDYYLNIPSLSYYKAFYNGITGSNSWLFDGRMPIKTEKFSSSGNSVSQYSTYDRAGNILMTVDPNMFISEANYEKLLRINNVVLPYDFNSQTMFRDSILDTLYGEISKILYCDTMGFKDFLNSEEYPDMFINDPYYLSYDLSETSGPILKLLKSYESNDSVVITQKTLPVLSFGEFPEINNIVEIDSAFIEFSPAFLKPLVNGSDHRSLYNLKLVTLDNLNFNSNTEGQRFTGTIDLSEFGDKQFININASESESIITDHSIANQVYNQSQNKFDIKDLLEYHILQNDKPLKGIMIDILPSDSTFFGSAEFEMNLSESIASAESIDGIYYKNWRNYASPRILIYAKTKVITERIENNYSESTLKYEYEDESNLVRTLKNLDNGSTQSRRVKSEFLFNGFYKKVSTRNYYSSNDYYKDTLTFNYLDLNSSKSDYLNNSTIYSYDKYVGVSKSFNPDNSYSLVNSGFVNGLTNYFGTINGPISIQTFIDETGRKKDVYSDYLGNVLREINYAEHDRDPEESIDTTDNPENLIKLITDFSYDDLYRIDSVKTPDSKLIIYSYDHYGNINKRITADAGVVQFGYDKNGNLRFSQDENQKNSGNNVYTFRNYDGLNRLLGLGVTSPNGEQPDWQNLIFQNDYVSDNSQNPYDNHLIINIYDSLISSNFSFVNIPSDYYSNFNFTKGRLVATAYRTSKSNPWGFKFYRYDARGRIIKFWNNIIGLGIKTSEYNFNSADMTTYLTYQLGNSDQKRFRYYFDNLERLRDYSLLTGTLVDPPESNLLSDYLKLFEYTYNANSQITQKEYKDNLILINYNYNSRNWLTSQTSTDRIFDYTNTYFANGNINTQFIDGSYKYNFVNAGALNFSFTYDKSNSLLKVEENHQSGSTYHLINNFDKDGNIKSLKRFGSENNLVDNFEYSYISGTNKLLKVSGNENQYSYDGNGNMISDNLNNLSSIKYDHRNLITEFRKVITTPSDPPSYEIYLTELKYDDRGMRIRKTEYLYTGLDSEPIFNEDAPIGWTALTDNFYVRDVSGNELAIYNSSTIKQWNLNALDNEGYLDTDGLDRFYIKDHLGSIRVVLNHEGQIVSAQDYDAWGFPLQDRQYDTEDEIYKFTGKERDRESGYDYFGARYYDSRIGRWGQVEPLLEKYLNFSPYCYGVNNPVIMKDINGLDVYIVGSEAEDVFDYLSDLSDDLTFKRDKKTGKLSVKGKTSNKLEELLVEAIDNPNVKVRLITTKYNAVINDDGSLSLIQVGLFGGSYKKDDITNATQYLNLDLARKYEEAGGSSIQVSIMHEITESYYSAITDPGDYTSERFNDAHNHIEKLENEIFPGLYRPQMGFALKWGHNNPRVENFSRAVIFNKEGKVTTLFDKLNIKE
ncbi:MAG TPA: RHS repeat-associated core domain-containing protein [Ignavibacteria bacterium]|nr:RHS repeat-associated core domain-containing protein [Ignavibacteria bacterium]